MGLVNGLGLIHPEVEVVITLLGANLYTGITGCTVIVDSAGAGFQGYLVITGRAINTLDLGHGVDPDLPVVLDPLEIDLQPAGRRTKFGEVLVELGNPATQIGVLLNEKNVFTYFCGFQGSGQTADPATHDQNSTCTRCAAFVCHA
jgi:hypothetical protein